MDFSATAGSFFYHPAPAHLLALWAVDDNASRGGTKVLNYRHHFSGDMLSPPNYPSTVSRAEEVLQP